MSDPLRKVSSGDALRIPAAAYNAFIDCAVDLRVRRATTKPDAQGRDREIVLVRNESASDCPRFGVLGIGGPITEPDDDDAQATRAFVSRVALLATLPAIASHAGRFVIPIEPIKAGAMGRAMLSGVGFARVLLPTGLTSPPRAADIADGEHEHLVITPPGGGAAEILWIEPAGMEEAAKLAIVRLGGASMNVFPVALEQAGGSGGGSSSAPSFTYDILDPVSGAVMLEAADPTAAPHMWVRPAAGSMTPATFGYAHRAADGTIALGWINEQFVQEACE